jgi:hypothetical protein
MADDEREPTEATQPEGTDPATGEPYEPVESPAPKRSALDRLLGRRGKPTSKWRDPSDGGRNLIDFSLVRRRAAQ